MRNALLCRGVVILALVGIAGFASPAQEKAKKKLPSQEEMMKRWQESVTPGDAHKKLEAFVGSWDSEVKMWMRSMSHSGSTTWAPPCRTWKEASITMAG
jgi:hypothetical protein